MTTFQLAPSGLRRSWFRASVFALFVSTSVAQQPPVAPAAPEPTSTGAEQSLGTVARNSKKQTSVRAKKVITEDDMDALATALPRLRMEGAENADEIIAGIAQYKASHTPEETEAAVRAWYERYDQDLAAAIQQNLVVNTLREENFSNGSEPVSYTHLDVYKRQVEKETSQIVQFRPDLSYLPGK